MTRWIRFLIVILVGTALGLVYGWIIQPENAQGSTLDSLRIDYKTDYALMVSEAFQVDNDPALASQRLSVLGEKSPAIILDELIQFAKKVGYSEPDIHRMQGLLSALGGKMPENGGLQP